MEAKEILEQVEKVVSPVYLVGGAVRDMLMKKSSDDYDFATPLLPDEIEAQVRKAGKKPYLVGKKYGTIGFNLKRQKIEVTTFRTEEYEDGNRKPEVAFVGNIVHDLSRRDFTINAMAYRKGKLIDPFKGKEDVEKGIIHAVGNARERFKEDPLRLLRVARFASRFGFKVHPDTMQKMKEQPWTILNVSKERWGMEMDKLLQTDKPSAGLDILAESRLLNFMFPELSLQVGYDQNSRYHKLTLWEHTKKVVDSCPKDDLVLRWAALLHDMAKPFCRTDKRVTVKLNPPMSDTFITRSNYIKHEKLGREFVVKYSKYLKWSNERSKQVYDLVKLHLEDYCKLRKYDNMGKEMKNE